MSNGKWARPRKIWVALGALLAVAAAGEVWLRVLPDTNQVQEQIRRQLAVDHAMVYTPDPELGALLAPARSDRIETPDFTYTLQTDHAGFPNLEPWPSRVDVAVLGNSLLIGTGVGLEGQLTSLLAKRLSGHAVLNFALPGGGTEHELRLWRKFVRPLRPMLVVATLWPVWDIENSMQFHHYLREGASDFASYRHTYADTHRIDPETRGSVEAALLWLRRQLRRSRLFRSATRSLESPITRSKPRQVVQFADDETIYLSIPDQVRLARGMERRNEPNIREIYFAPLERLREEVEADGGRLLVVLVPSKEEIYGADDFPDILRSVQDVRSGLQERRFSVLDLYPVFHERGRDQPPFYRTDMHPNGFGNQIAADAIADWISQQGIFSELP